MSSATTTIEAPARRWRSLWVGTAALVAAVLVAACGGGSSEAGVEVTGAWARASADMQTNGAAYLEITSGGEDDELVGVSVPTEVAATAELHETTMASSDEGAGEEDHGEDEDHGDGAGEHGDDMGGEGTSGMMDMREVPSIPVPADGTVVLEPGGYHVMLIELAEPLQAGESFELTLELTEAGTIVVPVEVRA